MIDSEPATQSRFNRLDNWGLRAITGAALLFGIFGLVTLILRAVHLLNARSLDVSGLQLQSLHNPELASAHLPQFVEASPAIIEAHYDSITLVIEGLPAGVRWLMVSEAALQSLLTIGLCLIVFVLGMALLDRRPFARSATIAMFSAAVLVMVTGMFAPFLGAIADAETVSFLGDVVMGNPSDTGFGTEGLVLFGMTIDPAPLGWGLALGIVASAFQLGQRMQRDTQGLV